MRPLFTRLLRNLFVYAAVAPLRLKKRYASALLNVGNFGV
jgi:hypothetical protein